MLCLSLHTLILDGQRGTSPPCIAFVMQKCDDDPQLIKLAQALYEYLGEEYHVP